MNTSDDVQTRLGDDAGARLLIEHPRMTVHSVGDRIWEIPPTEKAGMLVPARIYASRADVARTPASVNWAR